MKNNDVAACERSIEFANGFSLTMVCEGDRFLGIGAVRHQQTLLRRPNLPWTLYVETEDGFRYDTFRLLDVKASPAEATITFDATGVWMPRINGVDGMGDPRIKTRTLESPKILFRWTFRVVTEHICEQTWTGLAMHVEANSPGHPIHWILEDTTWEIDGNAAGCTLIQQDLSSMAMEQTVKADSEFRSSEHFFARTKGGVWEDSYPIDMLPRCAGSSPLDFQAKQDLALCIFAEKPSLTLARLEKARNETVIHYLDRPFFPLSERIATPERKLLVYRHPQPLRRHEWRNLWLDCFTEVRRRIHAQYGFELNPPRPQVFAHLWNKELDIYGREWVNPLIDVLPAYHRLGFLDVFTHGVFVGSSTDPKNRTKNICCNYEYRFADEFGGNAVMKKVIDAAHARGMRVWHWFGLQFDQDSRLWREHPDWILREVSGDPWDSGYRTLQCGRLRSGYGKYLLDAINRIKDETGLDNIFWDSYQNMGAICVDWHAPDKAPQIEELWRFQADLQRHGYVDQRCETATIFGIANVQVYAFDDEIEGSVGLYRRKWSTLVENDEAFAWLDASPGFFSDRPFTRDRFSPDKYFWMAAHRALPCFDARPWGPEHKGAPLPGPYLPGQELAEEYGRVNWLYLAALPFMHRLRVTEGGRYALWLDAANAPSVLWVFQDVEFGFSGIVVDLESKVACGSGRTKSLKAGRVYLLHLTADGMAGRLAELSEFP